MNNTVINSLMGSEDGVRRANVFGVDSYQPTLYMPQYITLSGISSGSGCDHYVSEFEIRDQYITALNYLVLSIELPEVKGVGRFGYLPHVGYKCIRSVSICSGDENIFDVSGEDLYLSCKNNNVALELSGHSHELNDISMGLTPNDTIKEAATVYVYIKTPFDIEGTFSSLKLSDCKITVTVTFNPVSDIIVYDSTFNFKTFSREFIYVSELSFIGYMIKNVQLKSSYIEKPRRIVGQINQNTVIVPEVHSSTALSIYVKPYYGDSDNKFISYPGYKQSEKDYIDAFVNRLLEDLVIVSENDPEDNFPESSEIVEVPSSGLVTIQDANIHVKIDNVPEDTKVYFHTNILIFGTRKNAVVYNLSKKFLFITGTYSRETNRIIFTNVYHTINVSDASIPVNLWTCQRNVYSGDNRSFSSKSKDLFVKDPFIKGIDFKNKTEVISRIEVRFGNDVLYSESSPISRVYDDLLNKCLGGNRTLKFNFTPNTFFKPTTLISNPSRGKDKLSVRAMYSSLDNNNPIFYVSKQLVVVCHDLYSVNNVNGIKVNKIIVE